MTCLGRCLHRKAWGPAVLESACSSQAGMGYWSQLLRDRSVDVLALDLDPPSMKQVTGELQLPGRQSREFSDIEHLIFEYIYICII